MIPGDQKNMTTQWCSSGRPFTADTQALNTAFFKEDKKKIHDFYEITLSNFINFQH